MTISPARRLLYLDSSAFLARLLAQDPDGLIDATLRSANDEGARVVASRLLWLEAARVAVRERLAANDIDDVVAANLAGIDRLPVTETVWTEAAAISQHVKTLDAIHLATCQLVGASLLSLDGRMCSVAVDMGIELASAA